ncbi:hypothetical protein WMY93_002965 [Mugilogobius chulae]|uniref:Uncharacterized protein n=1 Tax=Mugilogobius chulae TaxID=88201 RepID=A0AAW0PY16_9GOBI
MKRSHISRLVGGRIGSVGVLYVPTLHRCLWDSAIMDLSDTTASIIHLLWDSGSGRPRRCPAGVSVMNARMALFGGILGGLMCDLEEANGSQFPWLMAGAVPSV